MINAALDKDLGTNLVFFSKDEKDRIPMELWVKFQR
jgi:hypothetical protein